MGNNNTRSKELPSEYKCDTCKQIIYLCCEEFYRHNVYKQIVEECVYKIIDGIKKIHVRETYNYKINHHNQIDCKRCAKEYITIKKQTESNITLLDIVKLGSTTEFINTCTDCGVNDTGLISIDATAFSKLDRYLCEKCLYKYCCYDGCNIPASCNCPICKNGFCSKHNKNHLSTFKTKTVLEITSYSCDISRENLQFHKLERGYKFKQ